VATCRRRRMCVSAARIPESPGVDIDFAVSGLLTGNPTLQQALEMRVSVMCFPRPSR